MNDFVNGLFETIGAFLILLNVRRLLRDKSVRGVDYRVSAFFALWSAFNLYFYGSLHLSISLIGAACMVAGQLTWLALAIKYRGR